MGSFADRISFRGTHYKTKWAISMAEDVEKLRALIAGKVISINLLLATHSSCVRHASVFVDILINIAGKLCQNSSLEGRESTRT